MSEEGREWRWSRTSPAERGFGPGWKKLRTEVLARDGYICRCAECSRDGLVTPANEVDHVVPRAKARSLGWTQAQIDAKTNLQAINSECHKRKTLEENGKRSRPAIGVDGYPVER